MAFGRKKNNFNLLEVPKRFSMSKFVIHCEAHCQKFENSNLYISKILSALGGISLQICRFLFGNFGPFGLALLQQKKIHCFDGVCCIVDIFLFLVSIEVPYIIDFVYHRHVNVSYTTIEEGLI